MLDNMVEVDVRRTAPRRRTTRAEWLAALLIAVALFAAAATLAPRVL